MHINIIKRLFFVISIVLFMVYIIKSVKLKKGNLILKQSVNKSLLYQLSKVVPSINQNDNSNGKNEKEDDKGQNEELIPKYVQTRSPNEEKQNDKEEKENDKEEEKEQGGNKDQTEANKQGDNKEQVGNNDQSEATKQGQTKNQGEANYRKSVTTLSIASNNIRGKKNETEIEREDGKEAGREINMKSNLNKSDTNAKNGNENKENRDTLSDNQVANMKSHNESNLKGDSEKLDRNLLNPRNKIIREEKRRKEGSEAVEKLLKNLEQYGLRKKLRENQQNSQTTENEKHMTTKRRLFFRKY